MLKLYRACEEAKCNLSKAPQTAINVDSLYEGIDFSVRLTRGRYESMMQRLITQLVTLVKVRCCVSLDLLCWCARVCVCTPVCIYVRVYVRMRVHPYVCVYRSIVHRYLRSTVSVLLTFTLSPLAR
jgi:Hsp70 protein